ncbi:hypothetical protein HPP92_014083 [Vanilla planifolia]|uniref:Uncharacterized protein n=1 Tax=Vanilla planifolia TaxID=51239 RepID=A0A835UUF2_VANPL|nr:hypothetical protein HPP92_014524 [Vanilla planifolia]KAG0474397.1 hypothetical protein HPP92_014083 [Vanilla planifolia]
MSSLNPTYHPRSTEPMTQFDGPAEFLTESVPSYGYLSGPGRCYDGEISSSSETYFYVSPDSNVNSYGEGVNIGVIASAGGSFQDPVRCKLRKGFSCGNGVGFDTRWRGVRSEY